MNEGSVPFLRSRRRDSRDEASLASHRDGDTSTQFEKLGIFHIGDTWSIGLFTYIDTDSGDHIEGLIRAAQAHLRDVESTVHHLSTVQKGSSGER